MSQPINTKSNFINQLREKSGHETINEGKQGYLSLGIERQKEVDGIGMGVLTDGTPYLNQRGLAAICGVSNSLVAAITAEWGNPSKPRFIKIREFLKSCGGDLESPCVEVSNHGRLEYAYSDQACLAILEYYAFEAGGKGNATARENYRLLAGTALREAIYKEVGYGAPNKAWDQFHDRVLLVNDNVPNGYFGIFHEIYDIDASLIKLGAHVGDKFIPDISIGMAWSKYWIDNRLFEKYGERITYEHNFPDSFPQSKSNPQSPYCYPESALPEFRRWKRDIYLPMTFPKYLQSKSKQGQIPSSVADLAITEFAGR